MGTRFDHSFPQSVLRIVFTDHWPLNGRKINND